VKALPKPVKEKKKKATGKQKATPDQATRLINEVTSPLAAATAAQGVVVLRPPSVAGSEDSSEGEGSGAQVFEQPVETCDVRKTVSTNFHSLLLASEHVLAFKQESRPPRRRVRAQKVFTGASKLISSMERQHPGTPSSTRATSGGTRSKTWGEDSLKDRTKKDPKHKDFAPPNVEVGLAKWEDAYVDSSSCDSETNESFSDPMLHSQSLAVPANPLSPSVMLTPGGSMAGRWDAAAELDPRIGFRRAAKKGMHAKHLGHHHGSPNVHFDNDPPSRDPSPPTGQSLSRPRSPPSTTMPSHSPSMSRNSPRVSPLLRTPLLPPSTLTSRASPTSMSSSHADASPRHKPGVSPPKVPPTTRARARWAAKNSKWTTFLRANNPQPSTPQAKRQRHLLQGGDGTGDGGVSTMSEAKSWQGLLGFKMPPLPGASPNSVAPHTARV